MGSACSTREIALKKILSQPEDLERMGESEGVFILCSLKMSFTFVKIVIKKGHAKQQAT